MRCVNRLSRVVLATVFGVLALGFVFGGDQAAAQDAPATPPAEMSEEEMQLFMELQEIEQRLSAIQAQAFEQNPELHEAQEELNNFVIDAMAQIDPEVEANIDRLDEISEAAQAAQAQGDMEEAMAFVEEAESIQASVSEVHATALEDPQVEQAVESFEDAVFDLMNDIDPDTDELLERMDEIEAELGEDFFPGHG